jgi:hypothetical protein
MTILEAISNIYEHFVGHSIFEFEEYFKEKTLITDNKEELKAIYNEALKQLETSGLIKSIRYQFDNHLMEKWVLVKPIQNLDQSLTITGDLAAAVAQTINLVAEMTDDKYRSDPININREDIKYLLAVCMTFLNNKEEKE